MSDHDSDSETPLLRESIADILAGAYRAVSGKAVETTVTEEERPDTASSAESSDTIRPSQPGSATTVRRRSASVVTGPPIIGGESAGDGADSEERRGLTLEDSTARDESAEDPSPAVDTSTAQTDEPTTNPSGSGTPPNQVTFWGSPDLSDLATGTEIDTSPSASTLVPSIQTDGTAETAVEGNDNRPRPRFGPAPNTRPTAPTQRITCADWLSSLVDNIGAVLGAIITVMIFMLVFGSLLWAFGFGFHNYPYIRRDHPRDFKQSDGCREKLACRKQLDVYHKIQSVPYCQDRQEFLEAMGEGKRFGLDAPYYPKGCNYQWFNTNHICKILHRFDGLAIVGDTNAKEIFAGLTTLIREDHLWGASRLWDIPDPIAPACSCDGQFSRPMCEPFLVSRSMDVVGRWGRWGKRFDEQQTPIGFQPSQRRGHGKYESNYHLMRTPMIYEPVKSKANGWLGVPESTLRHIQRAMPEAQFKKVPIVFTFDSLNQKNIPQWVIQAYLKSWAHQLPPSHLWVNPGVSYETERLVREAGGESLATWNMTVDATQVREGWYGRRVGLVQAMMVLNWLDMLET
ncbi:putative maintenance of ploidy protein mob1 [Venturia inaequalis]|nr:putative maintenance of ploidy protein mob1 [Venturia inaequalis]